MALNLLPEYPTPVNPANRPDSNGPAAGSPQPSLDFQEMLSKAVAANPEPPEPAVPPVATAPPPLPAYTIRRGDTLSEVVATAMRQQGIRFSRSELYAAVNRVAAANGMANPNRIFPGRKLHLDAINQSGSTPAAKPAITAAGKPLPALQPPAHGRLTSLFGMRSHPVLGEEQHHDGIDISLPTGSPIQPVAAGTVTFAGENGGYGLLVEVAHENGITSRYAHLSELLVKVGEEINPGNTLGLAGRTGLATGSHLHLEIRRDQQPLDPLLLLSREKIEAGPLLAEAGEADRI